MEGLSALGSLEWVLARVAHVGAVNCLFNDVVRTNSSLAGLNYSAYRAALAERTPSSPKGRRRAGIDGALALDAGADPREG